MDPGPRFEARDIRLDDGDLAFEVDGPVQKQIWMRTDSSFVPNADAALATCLMPAMRSGGPLTVEAPVSPKLLRNQREFQAVQQAWSREWLFQDEPLSEIGVAAPTRTPLDAAPTGRVAAFFSGGVDSWSTVLDHPEITDLVFVRGFDLMPNAEHQERVAEEAEERARWAAAELGVALHVVETNLRELTDPLLRWEACFGCADAAVALFLAPLFDRVLIATDSDYEVQVPWGVGRLVTGLLGTESLELVEDGGRYSRVERTARIASHPLVRQTLRVCWENQGGGYNCGRCRKCVMTMVTLEALGARQAVATFPAELDLDRLDGFEVNLSVTLILWEDVLDSIRAAGRVDLERPVETLVARGKRTLGLPPAHRSRRAPGPAPTVRLAVVVPVWRQGRYLAGAVRSALAQEIDTGVGVVVVNDGCPEPETDHIGQALRDADPERVVYVRQENRGLPAARNVGIRRALAHWPHVEDVFPLDADNRLSPRTLATLRGVLAERPDAAWATPTLEFFDGEEGEWSQPEPYLTYRQLFDNQSDAGSLIRRSLLEAGFEFDETLTRGFEDWEFFLRASLAGNTGAQAGRCGFRYRKQPRSMLTEAQRQTESLRDDLRERHPDAYRPAALVRREHAEAPRFALVRCDAGDVLFTAACDLEPHRFPASDLLRRRREVRGGGPLQWHLPAVSVLTTTEAIESLDRLALAEQLLRLQQRLRDLDVVGLSLGTEEPAAIAMRTRTLAEVILAGRPPLPQEILSHEGGRRRAPKPLAEEAWQAAMSAIARGMPLGGAIAPPGSHAAFFEHRHVNLWLTTLPWSGPEADRRVEAEPDA
ncbi:MAG TPA: glycosyltransferase family A protein [Solirubrobacterales bacterium]|jgi:hypothetical protein